MSEPFVGEIILVGFNFAPAGWALCNGQLLAIAENDTLFALIGTTYGGDGQTTFGLPDLRGRVPLGMGQGPGLSPYVIGQMAGVEGAGLTAGQMPLHTHAIDTSAFTPRMRCRSGAGNRPTPGGNVFASSTGATLPYGSGSPNANMNSGAIAFSGAVNVANAGGSLPHENLQPYLALNFCISLFGIFPSQV